MTTTTPSTKPTPKSPAAPAKSPKTPKAKTPPNPWIQAVMLTTAEGFTRGERVVVRLSRDTDGKHPRWRILSATRTLLVAEPHLSKWVLAFRNPTTGKPVPAANPAKLDAHLQLVFKLQWAAFPGAVSK